MYVFLVAIFAGIMKNYRKAQNPKLIEGLIYPFFAILGALAALYGALQNPKVALYLGLSIVVILLGLVIKPKKKV